MFWTTYYWQLIEQGTYTVQLSIGYENKKVQT